ncbi:Transposon Ty3-G Gag-Pol polyprotein [Labeo rohita]|uniref:ribonuclease H n=1 Tax=Labeo rohita TaxID=84645 RepID=A0ABQ8M2J0_LABRO|nr:Transposon Ty3-G Gag-Pol polyprotein [Labeo rohita]
MSFSCSDRVILVVVKRVEVGRSLTVKQFQQLLGLMAAASNVIPFGLLYMRPLHWWLKTKGFSLRGNLHDQASAAVLPPLSESSQRSGLRQLSRELSACIFAAHVSLPESSLRGGSSRESLRFSSRFCQGRLVAQDQGVLPEGKPALHDQGPGVGSSLLPRNASDGRVPHQLGSGHEWPPRPRSMERSPSSLAHQLPGDAGHVSGLLRAGPSGAEWGPPHSTVPVSLQCPQEISLPTLPVLQGAAVSSEPTPQSLPPGNVAELGSSPPLRGSLERLVQSVPAGVLLQGTELAVHTNPEAEQGYHIQFSAPLPPFNGVFPTVVSPEQGLVMEQEVDTLLRKEAIEVVPPQDRESWFYSQYFIVPKKDGGLRPILDLRLLNRSVMRLKFKMLTVNQVLSQIRSEGWFVTIDLKDAYFHVSILPQHRKFLRFAFRGKAYQYRILPFGLALFPCTFTKCVDAALAPL